MMRISDTVKHLIIINVIFFIGSLLVGDSAFNLLSIWFPENNNFGFWQIFSHMFMHSKVFVPHILFNMLALWMFGSPLEQILGRKKFLFLYFSCGLGAVFLPLVIDYVQFNSYLNDLIINGYDRASILSTLNSGQYNTGWESILGNEGLYKFQRIFFSSGLGASGCVMGLLVGFGMLFPNSELMLLFLPIPIKAKYFIPLLLAYEIYSGIFKGVSLFGVNVNNFAHVGGAITGFLIMLYFKKNQFNQNRWDR